MQDSKEACIWVVDAQSILPTLSEEDRKIIGAGDAILLPSHIDSFIDRLLPLRLDAIERELGGAE